MEKKKISIYIADDDPTVLQQSIERWKYRGVEAKGFDSGDALIKGLKAAHELPTAVLTDYVMEGGGEELISGIRQSLPEIPIIVYSGLLWRCGVGQCAFF